MGINLCLKNYDCTMNHTFRKARREFFENDPEKSVQERAKKAVFTLGKRRGLERTLFEGLAADLTFENSWSKLPRNFKLLFLHGYQSWLFNEMVNHRLTLSKTSLIVGDLVLDNQDNDGKTKNIISISSKNKDDQVKIIE